MTIRTTPTCLGCGTTLTPENTHTKTTGQLYSRCKTCLATYGRSRYTPAPPRTTTTTKPAAAPAKTRPSLGRPWRRLIAQILHRDGHTCQLHYPGTWPGIDGTPRHCLGTATTADHIVPRSQGGTDHPSNLRAACKPCNQHRGDNPDPHAITDTDRQSRKWT
ncbi:HNH endonuclease [uncultured Friedmanniella sp.]|uniref:HNH endonuclease n=1 Tax=uncultured Friedmanniella sp. TaxID=335381 RepID=UPI0035CA0F31